MIVDCEHKTAPAGEGNAFSIGTTDIRGGRIDFRSAKRVSDETWIAWSRRLTPREGDLILAREAPVGQVGRVPAGVKVCLGQRTVLLRPDEHRVDGRYLHFLLIGPGLQEEIARLAAGSTVDHLNVADIRTLQLPALPARDEQRRIARVLGALDDKIEHNSRLSMQLADLARLRFESAVVRWRADSRSAVLGDLAAPSRESADATQPYIGLDAMPRGSTVLSEWAIADAPNGQAVRFGRGDVLFGKLRPYFKKVGLAPIDGRCSTEILVLRPKEPRLWGLLLGYVSSDAFISYCVQVSRGTKMPRAEWRDISAFPVDIPSDEQASGLTGDEVVARIRDRARP